MNLKPVECTEWQLTVVFVATRYTVVVKSNTYGLCVLTLNAVLFFVEIMHLEMFIHIT